MVATVLITGGAGFLGRKVLDALLERGTIGDSTGKQIKIDRIRVSDLRKPELDLPADDRIEAVYGDFTAPGAAEGLVTRDVSHIVHLAAAVSGECEQNFDLGMRVNFDGTRGLIDAARQHAACPRFVFTSSVAVYGGDMPEVLDDSTVPEPQNSYGAQKMACEYLIADASRKGFIDGRTVRLPTVVVRPGVANAAASSFASAVIREPLMGREYSCPVTEDTAIWVLSPGKVAHALVRTVDMSLDVWGSRRALKLPGITVTVQQMIDGVARKAGADAASLVTFEHDPFVQSIVSGWPTRFALERAPALGFSADDSIDSIVDEFVRSELA